MDASYSPASNRSTLPGTLDRPDLRGQTMPLTPADVHNVAFSKPPIGKRGYNEDEVDAFLDLVENELTRLVEENADLRQRIEELDREQAAGGGVAAAPAAAAQPAPAVP